MLFKNTVLTSLTVLVLLANSPFAADSVEFKLPDTRVGELTAEFIKAFNSGDKEQWTMFISEYWKPSEQEGATERRLGFFEMLTNDLGPIEPVIVESSDEFSIRFLARGTVPQGPFEWIRIGFQIDTLAPNLILRASADPGENPKYAIPEGKLTDKDIAAFLEKYMADLAADDKFSGAAILAREGEPIFAGAFGLASKRWNIPNKLDTKFNLGSMNKMFTSVAIAQLVQQGELSFDDKVGTYLPDCPSKEIADKVTIHHLLTHTSGMQDYWEELFDSHWWEIKTVDQLAALIYDDPLLCEPGEEFHYSNSGPIVLGQIIEKVSGRSYYDYIRENICKPAGMINTDCYEVDTPTPNLAIGYTKETYTDNEPRPDHWRNNLFMHASKGGPAGGGYSTVEDLIRFDLALHSGKLLSKEYVDIITAGKVEIGGPEMKYGYLFGDENFDGIRSVGHNGGAPGINAELKMYVDLGYTVAVMANYDMAADQVAHKMDELIRQQQE
ncbi:MAG: serine hydrolase [bacterium]|nr:serine hydrolase [bacterium]